MKMLHRVAAAMTEVRTQVVPQRSSADELFVNGLKQSDLTPNYVPALMRGSRVKGPLLFWSEGVARTEEQQRAANSAGVW